MEKLKSRKLWFFLASLAACIGLAYVDRFTWEVGAFLLALPASYGIVNVANKQQQVAIMDALARRGTLRDPVPEPEEVEHDEHFER